MKKNGKKELRKKIELAVLDLVADASDKLHGALVPLIDKIADIAAEAVKEPEWIEFDGEDPHLPPGVPCEYLIGGLGWTTSSGFGHYRKDCARKYVLKSGAKYSSIRFRRSDIYDPGEKAVGMTVKAWNDDENMSLVIVCDCYHPECDHNYHCVDGELYKHVRLWQENYR